MPVDEITAPDVCQTIEDVLARRARREASRIHVAIDHGVVSLKGRVRSWDERQAIVGAIAHARGISAVDDQIRIDPYD